MAPAGASTRAGLDGISIVPTLTGRTQPPREYLYWETFTKGRFFQAIRMGNWKGVREGLAGTLELYDLARDHREQHDVAAQHPDVVARMTEKLRTVRTENREYPVDKPKVKPKNTGSTY